MTYRGLQYGEQSIRVATIWLNWRTRFHTLVVFMPIPDNIRDTLFGDSPLDAYPPSATALSQPPWPAFIRAREAVAAGQIPAAIALWQEIVATDGLESRHYAQAWHFLRAYGVQPAPGMPFSVKKTS